MAAVRHFEFAKFWFFLSRGHSWNQNLHRHTKFHWNRMIRDWDIAIKPFSKWRPSAILKFSELLFLLFYNFGHSACVWAWLRTKVRVNRTILLLLLSCAKTLQTIFVLSTSRRQPHLHRVSAVDRRQIWSVDKSWRCVTLYLDFSTDT